MKIQIKWLLLIVLLMGGIACASSSLSSQSHNNRPEINTTNKINQKHYETEKPIISSTTEPSAINTKDDNFQSNKTWRDKFFYESIAFLHKLIFDPNALSSFLVMIFTGVLAWVSIYQGRQQATALQLARDEFSATHRPHIRIRRIDNVIITAEKPITAKIDASNIGVTEARIVQVGVDVFFRDKDNPITAKFSAIPMDVSVIILPPGKSAIIEFKGTYIATAQDIANFQAGKNELCALGILNYQDTRNIMRSTSFFRIYKDSGARFIPAPDDATQGDREYEN